MENFKMLNEKENFKKVEEEEGGANLIHEAALDSGIDPPSFSVARYSSLVIEIALSAGVFSHI